MTAKVIEQIFGYLKPSYNVLLLNFIGLEKKFTVINTSWSNLG